MKSALTLTTGLLTTLATTGLLAAGAYASTSQSPEAGLSAPQSQNRTASQTTDRPVRLAAACGWYVISGCYRSSWRARKRARRIGGYVVNTSSGAYPNFRPGYYCAVFGPYGSKWTAKNKARYVHPSYVKNGC